MTLPRKVKVGFRQYTIKPLGKDIDHDGQHNASERVIRVTRIEPVEDANTLIHEILHACWKVGDLGDDSKEERCVTVLANLLTEVIKDNPEVVEYLIQSLGAKDGH